jgi:ComF family protein
MCCGLEGSLLCKVCAEGLAVVPSRCYRCKRWTDEFSTCPACRKHTPLKHVWAVTPCDGQLAKTLLRRIKFDHARAGADVIARLLAGICSASDNLLVTYVPTADARVRERGYDQSEQIARGLARRLDRPFVPLLARLGNQRQLGQRREVRLAQMDGAFRPIRPEVLRGKHVLLVDDVLTTGTTCQAAARTLRQAGARHVSAAVFAVA